MIGWSRTMTHARQSGGGCLMRRLLVILATRSRRPGIDPLDHLRGAGA
jgi:hypothetical protein